MESAIILKNLTKTFKIHKRGSNFKEVMKDLFNRKYTELKAVNNIDLKINKGEIVGFLGPNGAGKSTAIKMMTGILYPTSGVVSVLGYNPWTQRKKYLFHIGAVFGQKSQLWWDLPPIDAYRFNKSIYEIPDEEFNKRISYMSRLLGVKEIIKKPTRQLSLGERMKCEFIMAILHNPEVIFLDEPTVGLDIIAKEKIRDFIKGINKKYGTTVILTTHDLEDVKHLAKRVVVINHGKIVMDNSMDEIKKHLGGKKYITVIGEKKLIDINRKGLILVKHISDYSAQYELDRSVLKLKLFINSFNKKNKILDMTIEDPPIEELIKEVYDDKK